MSTPRGIRNHNPGNIVRTGERWRGMADDQSGDPRFVVFKAPKWGIRAMAVLLQNYQERHGLDTIQKIVSRWAPEDGETAGGRKYRNPTDRYVASVAGSVGADPESPIDVTHPDMMERLVKALIQFENGQQPYTQAQIHAGMALAGIEVERKPLSQTRTVRGGEAAGVGAVGIAGIEAIRQAAGDADQIVETIQPYIDQGSWIALGLVVLGIGYMLYARWDDRRQELR